MTTYLSNSILTVIRNLSNPIDVESFDRYVARLKKKGAWVELKEKRLHTPEQNAYLHVLLGYFAAYHGMAIDDVKVNLFKKEVNADIFMRPLHNALGVETDPAPCSVSALTKEEMSTAISRFRDFSLNETGLYLPEPHEEAYLYAQKMIDDAKEYLYNSTDV